MLDNRKYPRGERFKTLGLVNQPGFQAPSKADEYGLWLDEPTEPEPAGIDEKTYGKPTGVLGFRLFPNPDFGEAARKKWDGERFHERPEILQRQQARPSVSRRRFVRFVPHRAQPDQSASGSRKSEVGESRLSHRQSIHQRGRVFACNVQKGGLFYEMIEAQPRGTSDTSRHCDGSHQQSERDQCHLPPR